MLVTASDPLFAGISTAAAQLIEEDYVVSPIANYFFAAPSAVVLAAVVTLVTELLLVKMTERMRKDEDAAGGAATAVLTAGRPTQAADTQDSVHQTGTATGGTAEGTAGEGTKEEPSSEEELLSYSAQEVRALLWSGLALAVFLALYFTLLVLPASPLAGKEGVLESPLLTDVAVPIALAFLVVGLT